MRILWDDDQLHHHFQLVERTSGKAVEESIEIHTVELSKYNVGKDAVSSSSGLELVKKVVKKVVKRD